MRLVIWIVLKVVSKSKSIKPIRIYFNNELDMIV